MAGRGRNLLFVLGMVMCIAVIAFCIKGTAYSMEKSDDAFASYYRALEKQYIEEVNTTLSGMGYKNSGVMLTKTIDENKERSYTLSINNKMIKSPEEIAEVMEEIWYNNYSSQIGGYSDGSNIRTNISTF